MSQDAAASVQYTDTVDTLESAHKRQRIKLFDPVTMLVNNMKFQNSKLQK